MMNDSELSESSRRYRRRWLTPIKFLFFCASREEIADLGWGHLAFGLLMVWAVGIGRHWDHDLAPTLAKTGLGSVAYVFALAFWLWMFIKPLGPKNWTYFNILTVVCLTAPPGLIYAIPVERLYDYDAAQALNVRFLGIVAAWRVALLLFYLIRAFRLLFIQAIVGATVPIMIIVFLLVGFNLERAVFDVMGGLGRRPLYTEKGVTYGKYGNETVIMSKSGEVQRNPVVVIGTTNDAAYEIIFSLLMLSILLSLPLFIVYIFLAATTKRNDSKDALPPELLERPDPPADD